MGEGGADRQGQAGEGGDGGRGGERGPGAGVGQQQPGQRLPGGGRREHHHGGLGQQPPGDPGDGGTTGPQQGQFGAPPGRGQRLRHQQHHPGDGAGPDEGDGGHRGDGPAEGGEGVHRPVEPGADRGPGGDLAPQPGQERPALQRGQPRLERRHVPRGEPGGVGADPPVRLGERVQAVQEGARVGGEQQGGLPVVTGVEGGVAGGGEQAGGAQDVGVGPVGGPGREGFDEAGDLHRAVRALDGGQVDDRAGLQPHGLRGGAGDDGLGAPVGGADLLAPGPGAGHQPGVVGEAVLGGDEETRREPVRTGQARVLGGQRLGELHAARAALLGGGQRRREERVDLRADLAQRRRPRRLLPYGDGVVRRRGVGQYLDRPVGRSGLGQRVPQPRRLGVLHGARQRPGEEGGDEDEHGEGERLERRGPQPGAHPGRGRSYGHVSGLPRGAGSRSGRPGAGRARRR
ncbi:predicted protein [Streptomyces albidoflavus]|nr:predicted protein [Streptomyces albidoflavus]